MFKKAKAIKINEKQKLRLEFLIKSGKTPQKIVMRARIIMKATPGEANHAIAKKLGVSRPTVILTRKKFEQNGINGILKDASRPGRNKLLTPEKEESIIQATLQEKPLAATHWSIRSLAKSQGVAFSTVQRVWKRRQLQPFRTKTFKISNEKNFVEKVRDVVGLYMSPPSKALVLSVDEKSQIQALDRTQPGLPLKKGRCFLNNSSFFQYNPRPIV